jgi:alkyl hydroperoxide reductase subunit F
MLDAAIKNQLKDYLERLQQPIELVATLKEGGARSEEMRSVLQDIAGLSDKVHVRYDGQDARRPSFSVGRLGGEAPRIRFAGVPLGHEFTSLVLALLQTSGYPPRIEEKLVEQIRALPGTFDFETFVSLSCHNCPDVVQALNMMAVLNPGISSTMIDGGVFGKEAVEREIMAVPTIFLNGEPFDQGRLTLEEILAKIDTGAGARAAEEIAAKPPFDVLIVGGGPAGAAAAVYSARKGLRTGLVAERIGGQMLDTLAIENLVAVKETEGPRLAAALEERVREHGVDVIAPQRVEKIAPGEGGLIEAHLAGGASLKGRALIVAAGARWRNMDVPGEHEYKAHGVAYCPHCDGPLFKGKRVAVIGGGNSGVEAAIDLAGVASHVTLVVRTALRADAVLQEKLRGLPNAAVVENTRVLEVTGDGKKVNGLVYKDETAGETRRLDLEGIFVQIGQAPNTEWLKDTLKLSPRGEIEIDDRARTSMPGVFAAGDCTTTPFKQIVIALGEGAKASLSAFDYLIRQGGAK